VAVRRPFDVAPLQPSNVPGREDMTEKTADRVASLVLGAAALGAMVVVLRTPSLRRLAWRLTVVGLTGALPAWIRQEITKEWAASGQRSALAPIA